MDRKVLVTGIGMVTERGSNIEDIWESISSNSGCHKDRCGIELDNDLKKKYLGIIPCAIYGVSAANNAWNDGFKDEPEIDRNNWGVYCGTAFGGFTSSNAEQCRKFLEVGPGGLLPGIFNNKGIHLTADIVALEKKLMGSNTTFTSGRLASSMALMQAFDDICHEEAQGAVVVGTEANDQLIEMGHKLLGVKDTSVFSNGAGSLILQGMEDINLEKYKPKGYIRAVEAAGAAGEIGRYSHRVKKSLIDAMEAALEFAELDAGDIDLILSGEGTSAVEELFYKKAYEIVFGNEFGQKLLKTKHILGDSMGAFPIMNTAFGLLMLDKQTVPIQEFIYPERLKYIMVTADDPHGNAMAIIIEQYQ